MMASCQCLQQKLYFVCLLLGGRCSFVDLRSVGPNLVTSLNWTPIFEWRMDTEKTCVSKKIRVNAQNLTTYLGSTVT